MCNFSFAMLQFHAHNSISSFFLAARSAQTVAILNAPPPTDLAALRSFLGLTTWYNKFVPNYADVVEPLRVLLRKNSTFQWNDERQVSFDQVRQLIVNSPALALFDPARPTIVSTDASDYGLGAVLTQMDNNGEERTVAFASRSLSDAERKYSIVEKEALLSLFCFVCMACPLLCCSVTLLSSFLSLFCFVCKASPVCCRDAQRLDIHHASWRSIARLALACVLFIRLPSSLSGAPVFILFLLVSSVDCFVLIGKLS
uniref:Reverse transcriptase/retrotransposon-derived protein RNase H-like domain-containing protein n=1 Tax=Acanthochromis polyacanthus TaxID=80966 RepID=A0A3Q1G3C6_9TELE